MIKKNTNNERKKESVKALIMNFIKNTTILIGIALLFSYMKTMGYFTYFKIDTSLIFLDNISNIIYMSIMCIILTVPLLGIFLLKIIYNQPTDKFNEYEIKIINFLKKIPRWILTVFYYCIGPIVIYLLIYLYIKIMMIENCWIIALEFTIIDIVIYYGKIFIKWLFKDKLFRLWSCILFLIVLIMGSIFAFEKSGYNEAQNKTSFIISQEYILVYNTNEYAIVCNYAIDEETNTIIIYNSKYKKIPIENLEIANKKFDKVILETNQ